MLMGHFGLYPTMSNSQRVLLYLSDKLVIQCNISYIVTLEIHKIIQLLAQLIFVVSYKW